MLAVLLEDAVALLGIVLTLIVAGSGYLFGAHPVLDASVAIVVGVLLGAMATFLAAINRRLLIDTSDPQVDRAAERWLAERRLFARVHSLVLDDDSAILFVRANDEIARFARDRRGARRAICRQRPARRRTACTGGFRGPISDSRRDGRPAAPAT